MLCIDFLSQNMILNAGDFTGRMTAGFIAAYCGLSNAVIGSTLGSAIITFGVIGLTTRALATSIGLFIGFFIGVCQLHSLFFFVPCQ